MKKVILLFILCMATQVKVLAWHIVGGEMELIHLQDFTYQLNLIQYFDRAQTNNTNPDNSVTVYFFRNSDDNMIRTETLEYIDEFPVTYTNPDCARDDLQTGRIIYSAQITLEPEIFFEKEGYYVTWERCCRNESVVNIVNPSGAGMNYVLEFPPVIKNNKRFINSSPQLFPPLSDYTCVNQLYYTSFAGIEKDGDSIAYSLQLPLNSSAQSAIPIPKPKPFIDLMYANGTDLDNIVPGNPSLNITSEGYLTVSPNNPGLYVFSVLVEEFRNGKKIGAQSRDFQMLVLDDCNSPTPPKASVILAGETEYYEEGEIINYSLNDKKCFDYFVVDTVGESVTFTAVGVNFEGDVSDIFEFNSKPINSKGDTLSVQVCLSICPYIEGEPFIIDLIASDNACPLPQRDTVRMTFMVESPPNTNPYYDNISTTEIYKKKVIEGQELAIDELLIGKDFDLDSLEFFFVANDYNPDEYGMTLISETNTLGEKSVRFQWNTSCESSSFGDKNTFELGIVLEDLDTCRFINGDTLFYELEVVLPHNALPTISVPSTSYNKNIKSKTLEFNVFSEDLDGDSINLRAIGIGFDLINKGVKFIDQDGKGSISSNFSWELSCENLNINNSQTFLIKFAAEDKDLCQVTNKDSVIVAVNVTVPFNNPPRFEIENVFPLTVNEEFVLDIIASDGDNLDLLTLDLLSINSAPPSEGFSFEGSTGVGTVSSTLTWTPECGLLGDNFEPDNYSVDFIVYDDNCPNIESEVHTISFEINELDVDYGEFAPPNAFSPNGDGHNDTYTLSNLTDEFYNLPPDNCADQFQSIVIFDRAGGTVFKSSNREFEWTGDGADAGTYYYHIDYLHTDYKGVLTLVR